MATSDTDYDRFNLPARSFEPVEIKRVSFYKSAEVNAYFSQAEEVVNALKSEVHAIEGELTAVQDISAEKTERIEKLEEEAANAVATVSSPVQDEVTKSVTLLSEATRIANEHVAQAEEVAQTLLDDAQAKFDSHVKAGEEERDLLIQSAQSTKDALDTEIEVLINRKNLLRKELKEILDEL